MCLETGTGTTKMYGC